MTSERDRRARLASRAQRFLPAPKLRPLAGGVHGKGGEIRHGSEGGNVLQITLDSGEKIIVNHEKGVREGGRINVEVSKFMGFSSDRIFDRLDRGRAREVITLLRDVDLRRDFGEAAWRTSWSTCCSLA